MLISLNLEKVNIPAENEEVSDFSFSDFLAACPVVEGDQNPTEAEIPLFFRYVGWPFPTVEQRERVEKIFNADDDRAKEILYVGNELMSHNKNLDEDAFET